MENSNTYCCFCAAAAAVVVVVFVVVVVVVVVCHLPREIRSFEKSSRSYSQNDLVADTI